MDQDAASGWSQPQKASIPGQQNTTLPPSTNPVPEALDNWRAIAKRAHSLAANFENLSNRIHGRPESPVNGAVMPSNPSTPDNGSGLVGAMLNIRDDAAEALNRLETVFHQLSGTL